MRLALNAVMLLPAVLFTASKVCAFEVDPLFFRSIQHWEIRATSAQELKMEFDGKFNGRMGWTSSLVTYNYSLDRADDVCRVKRFRAQCNATIKLPRWHDVAKAPQHIQDWWKTTYEVLRVHEFGHADICLDVARDVERAVQRVRPRDFCGQLSAEVTNAAEAVIDTLNGRQEEYDRITNHGRTQERYLKSDGSSSNKSPDKGR